MSPKARAIVGLARAGTLCVLAVVAASCAGPPQRAAPPPAAPGPQPEARIIPYPKLPPQARPPLPRHAVRRSPSRPSDVAGNLDVALGRRWKYIVIHHSGTDEGSEAAFDREHKTRGWRGVGYDFVIGNGQGVRDGLVQVTFRWEGQLEGAHAGDKEFNDYGIGICLVGDFNRGRPTPKQMDALVGLINYLQARCHISTDHILLHRQVRRGGTECPGRNFPFYEVMSALAH